MNLGAIPPRTQFQDKLVEANQQISLGLIAVEGGDFQNSDETASSVAYAAQDVTDALSYPAPAAAKAIAAKAVDALTTAHATLAAMDDDGYPLHLNAGVDQARAAMELIEQAHAAAVE